MVVAVVVVAAVAAVVAVVVAVVVETVVEVGVIMQQAAVDGVDAQAPQWLINAWD